VVNPQNESTDAGHMGGLPRSSDEVSVMEMVKLMIEPELESHFHPDLYGYRPGKSAHKELWTAKRQCVRRGWVLEMDVKGFFEELDHGLLMLAVRKHVKESWQLMYIQRWLTTPVQHAYGRLEEQRKGTPQGAYAKLTIMQSKWLRITDFQHLHP